MTSFYQAGLGSRKPRSCLLLQFPTFPSLGKGNQLQLPALGERVSGMKWGGPELGGGAAGLIGGGGSRINC